MTQEKIEGHNPFRDYGVKNRKKQRAEKTAARIIKSLQRQYPNSVIVVAVSDTCPCIGRAPRCSCSCD